MRIWLIIIASGIVTFSTRASFIALGDRLVLPPVIERSLKYVAPAAFAAISIPLVLGGDGFAEFGEDVPRIGAGLAASFVVYRFTNLPLSLVAGMGTLWILTWLL